MKKGICLFSLPGETPEERFRNAREYGFEGVEVGTLRSEAERQEIKGLSQEIRTTSREIRTMSEERLKILRMLEERKVTTEEAVELIEAVEGRASADSRPTKGKAEFLRVRIWEDDEEKIKINLPLALAHVALHAIPTQARERVLSQGIDLEQILQGLADDLQPVTLVEIQDEGDRIEVVLE